MALPEWPAGFPQRPDNEEDLIGDLYQEPIRTEMEDGPVRARRRSTTTWSTLNPLYAFNPSQFPAFQTFVRDTLNHGASAFTMPVWKPGVGLMTKTVKLAGPIAIRQTFAKVFVRLPLSVRDY